MSELQFERKCRACPICGSTHLKSASVIDVLQNEDGTWTPILPSGDDIDYHMNNVNNEVECMNDTCGDPYDGETGKIVRLQEDEDFFMYWMKNIRLLDMQANDIKSPEDLSAEDKELFSSWVDHLHYSPWSGVIGDTIEL